MEVAIHSLDDGGAAFYPIAAIKVVDAAEGTVASVMNVAADHPVETTPLSLSRDGFFECPDIGYRICDGRRWNRQTSSSNGQHNATTSPQHCPATGTRRRGLRLY